MGHSISIKSDIFHPGDHDSANKSLFAALKPFLRERVVLVLVDYFLLFVYFVDSIPRDAI